MTAGFGSCRTAVIDRRYKDRNKAYAFFFAGKARVAISVFRRSK